MPEFSSTANMLSVAVSGSHGLIGSALTEFLSSRGYAVTPLSRNDYRPVERKAIDAIIHLGGESIGDSRWTADRKRRIIESRVKGTARLIEAMGRMARPPQTLLCASAIGFYGDRGDEELSEHAECGTGFLADVCAQWEQTAELAGHFGVRVIRLRFGMVLSPLGGALPKILLPFRYGLGGKFGTGNQYVSWIGIDDAVCAILHCLTTPAVIGAVNIVSPQPVTNAEFVRLLGKVLHRPAVLPVPAIALKIALGEMAKPLLLDSARVIPGVLLASGFQFQTPDLERALQLCLSNQ